MATANNVDETSSAISQQDNPTVMFLLNDRDINEILARKFGSDNVALVDWKLMALCETKGFTGQYYHLHIAVSANGNTQRLRFFAKTPPSPSSPQFQLVQHYDTFNKEITVYTDLLKDMMGAKYPHWTVECYLDKRNVIIVLEDATTDGYATLDKYVPFDYDHCVLTLKTLSKLHSRSLILDERLRRENGRTLFDIYGHLFDEVLFAEGNDRSESIIASGITGVNVMIDLIQEFDDDERMIVKRRTAAWCRKISRLLAPSTEQRNVICHRDVWANNIMFRHDSNGKPNGCYMIDFQFLSYCPPAIDFMCLLYLTTDRATRDRHFDSFAKMYHDSFARELAEAGLDVEDHLSWMTFLKSCEYARNISLTYAMLNLQVMLLSTETIEDYFRISTDDLECVLYEDGRAELVRYECEKHPAYKTRVLEIIFEAKDRLSELPPELESVHCDALKN